MVHTWRNAHFTLNAVIIVKYYNIERQDRSYVYLGNPGCAVTRVPSASVITVMMEV